MTDARPPDRPVILASASPIRAELLTRAGVTIALGPARIDEDEVKRALRQDQASAEMAAETLAELKAQRVSRRYPGCLVIGCDQMLDCDGVWYDKPVDRAAASQQLETLSGRTHRLISAVVLLRDGARIWHHVETATLTMRSLSPAFMEAYLDAAGRDVLGSVGSYQLEGLGAQLFSRIDGDYFTILGLPLLPLLEMLRQQGVLLR